MSDKIKIHDLSDPANVKSGMFKGLSCLRAAAQADGELWTACYVFACTCIDGLASKPGNVGASIQTYVKLHFQELDNAIGAKVFYESYRCDAVHSFAIKHPYLIGLGGESGPYRLEFESRPVLNVERFVQDVLNHLAPANAASLKVGSDFSAYPPITTLNDPPSGRGTA